MGYSKDSETTLRPEIELLIQCCRTFVGSGRPERAKELASGTIDWDYLLYASILHGVMPLLYCSLRRICPEAIPHERMRELRRHFCTNVHRNVALTEELFRLMNLLEANGIPFVPLRGPILSQNLYGDVSLRHFDDLDILIRKKDIPRAGELLISDGYKPHLERSARLQTVREKHHCHNAFVQGTEGPVVEVHWFSTPSFFSRPVDFQRVSGRLVQISVDGKSVPSLSPEDLLLMLCVHGAKHFWERLGWICDVAKLIHVHKGTRWEKVVNEACRLRAERTLLLGLIMAGDLCEIALPSEFRQKIEADSTVRSLARDVRRNLFRRDGSRHSILRTYLFRLRMHRGLMNKICYLVRSASSLMTPSVLEQNLVPLPDSLFPFYYLLRPVRLLLKEGLRLMRCIG